MAAPGSFLFAKELTPTDVDHRLHWPSEFLSELPVFNGGNQVGFLVKELNGKVWELKCSQRKTGPYGKPVVSSGWLPLLHSRGNIRAGDKVIFYKSAVPGADFAIRFKRRILLFGADINDNIEE